MMARRRSGSGRKVLTCGSLGPRVSDRREGEVDGAGFARGWAGGCPAGLNSAQLGWLPFFFVLLFFLFCFVFYILFLIVFDLFLLANFSKIFI